jgi:predicted nucleic acid-binding protein
MIVLDTNVLSEMIKPKPDVRVARWVDGQPIDNLFTTAVTQGEVLYGIAILPKGKRRSLLETTMWDLFARGFAGRILPFDEVAVPSFAEIMAHRRQAGRPIAQIDAQIAAIARSRGATLATRNARDFEDCGVGLVDPWAS